MCGRFSLRVDRGDIQRLPGLDIDVDEWVDEEEFVPRYNIAPRTQAPVIRRRDRSPSSSSSSSSQNNDSLIMQTMKWGLVPHWSKVEDKSLNTTNARSENLIAGGGMWASIKGKQRYYEWLTKGKDKLPHFTKRKDGKLLLMAGLYDSVVLEGKTLWTFTIVTTDANKEFSWLHDRQPVFLTTREALYQWLDTSSQTWTPKLTEMVQPYSGSVPLACYAVPKEVGKVGTESPTYIEPITDRKDGIEAMFSKQKQKASPTKTAPTKRKAESITPSPDTKGSQPVKLEDDHPDDKKIKLDHGDDSNQPLEEKKTCMSREPISLPDQKPVPRQLKPSPKKSSAKSKAPPGNSKISSFFAKG
ncbi:Abasic site processing protein [Psilocybe cubensis]|uniref:DUF159-domain-containing protein n=2 Tax=Psilocybe cubensis TaxID=181762 RepID=A0A8H7XKY2_PSICU|nr:Abasic site processing protein [Psilocybe cubensis]KAH9477014.1 Abasic site processing protein [Psilocybe cubensis]